MRGTVWSDDRCDGTFFRSKQHTVVVRDFTQHRTVVLQSGEHYLALMPYARIAPEPGPPRLY